MSVRLMSQVFEADPERVGSTQKLVLLALADHANDDGVSIYPSMGRLCKRTGLTDRAVQKTMKALIQAGIVELVGKTNRGTNSYALNVEALANLVHPEPQTPTPERGSPPPEPGSPLPPNDVRLPPEPRSPDPSINHQEDPPSDPSGTISIGAAAPMSAAASEYFTQFKRKRWSTTAQREKFESTEAKMGPEAMMSAVRWAAERGISDIHAICTAARKWGSEAKKKGRTNGTNQVSGAKHSEPDADGSGGGQTVSAEGLAAARRLAGRD